jgi:hypothetical protein
LFLRSIWNRTFNQKEVDGSMTRCKQPDKSITRTRRRKNHREPGQLSNRPGKKKANPKTVQFNWRRHWSNKVAPHLQKELVQVALDVGMMLLDSTWRRGDAPFLLGSIPLERTRIVKGKLSWYRPFNRCHWIAFFSMAIGVLNYPNLDWRFVSGDRHTVPVGYDADGNSKVVMDILLFDSMTAEESITFASRNRDAGQGRKWEKVWEKLFQVFVQRIVPAIRASAQGKSSTVSALAG